MSVSHQASSLFVPAPCALACCRQQAGVATEIQQQQHSSSSQSDGMAAVAHDAQLLQKLQHLNVSTGGHSSVCSGSAADAAASHQQHSDEAHSLNVSVTEVPSSESEEDDRDHSPARGSSGAKSAHTLHESLSRRHRSSESSAVASVATADASAAQMTTVSSGSSATAGQQSALHYYQPHDGFGQGCPAPACFEERVSTAMGIYRKLDLRDGELGESSSLSAPFLQPHNAMRALLP